MHEILQGLSAGATALDLGSARGSFPAAGFPFRTVRVDRDVFPGAGDTASRVQADAAQLPFRDRSIDAGICNHSLEHMDNLAGVLAELCRVLKPGAALYVSVPDASTVTDRIYRWLGKGGGHVNAFLHAEELAREIEIATGLRRRGTRLLYTSLSFLNGRNIPGRRQRKLLLFGGGSERAVVFLNALFRGIDRWAGTRLSVYGWAFYFGTIAAPIDTRAWKNVCARCGAAHPADRLTVARRHYCCPQCGARNAYFGE